MLTIKNLYVYYQKEKDILKGLCLRLEGGHIHGLVGFNGAGKTTLLNSLYGFIQISEGEIIYNNRPLQRKEIAYLEAENYYYSYMTGNEYLSLFKGKSEYFDTDSWQKLFSLPLNDVTENYSTGMRKKLALLAVLKQDKPLIILDEPFNGLDLESTHLLSLILAQLRKKGKTVLITSHIYESLTGCCDYIHHLKDGVIDRSYVQNEFSLLQQELQDIIEKQSAQFINQLL